MTVIESAHHNYENCVCTECGDITLELDILVMEKDGDNYTVTGVKSKSMTEIVIPSFVTIIGKKHSKIVRNLPI